MRPLGNRNEMRRRTFLSSAAAMAGATMSGCVPGSAGDVPELVWGRRGFADGKVLKPRAATIDQHDRIYLVDTTGRIQCFDVDGQFLHGWKTPAAKNGRPTGLGFDPNTPSDQISGNETSRDEISGDGNSGDGSSGGGRILVADTHYYRVLAYTTDGVQITDDTIGGIPGPDPGQFAFLTDVAIDADGTMYVGEYNAQDRIQQFDRDGNFVCLWGGTGQGDDEFFRPQSLRVRDGVLYVADACNHRIKRYDLSDRPSPNSPPRRIDTWGRPGRQVGLLGYPYGIDFLSDGNMVVVEYQNARVQLFSPDGRPLATWGSPGFEPGMLNGPWAVVVDSKDRVSVVDSNNHRVQRFTF